MMSALNDNKESFSERGDAINPICLQDTDSFQRYS